jgi:hypothetical protein
VNGVTRAPARAGGESRGTACAFTGRLEGEEEEEQEEEGEEEEEEEKWFMRAH